MFFVMSSDDTPVCPVCGGTLKYRDTRLRIRKKEGGVKEYLMIRRLRCTDCHRHHNELPDCLVPHKHYEAEVISGVLDGIVTSFMRFYRISMHYRKFKDAFAPLTRLKSLTLR